jgi:Plavaka transposase
VPQPVPSFTFRIPPAITTTTTNTFGLYREYRGIIGSLPDQIRKISFFTSRTTQLKPKPEYKPPHNPNLYGPCKNASVFSIEYWYWVLGKDKTISDREFMMEMTAKPWYDAGVIRATNIRDIDDALTQPLPINDDAEPAYWEGKSRGWKEHTVKIAIPLPNMKDNFDPHNPRTPATSDTQSAPNIFSISGLYLRSLSSLIQEELGKPAARWFHWRPFAHFWKPASSSQPQRVHDELYSSPVWIEADKRVQELNIPGCNLPRAIAGLMFWSDSTCVSDFGTKSLWPIYLFFGNQSKYDRSRPSNLAGHQVGFLPTVSHHILRITHLTH